VEDQNASSRLNRDKTESRTRLAFVLCCVGSFFSCQRVAAQTSLISSGLPSGLLNPNPAVHLGPFDFHGGVNGEGAYDDLATIGPSGPESDFYWSLSPWGSIQAEGANSRIVRAYYQPSFVFYTEHSDLNSINHAGNFSVIWPFNRLTLSLNENVSVGTYIVRDIAERATASTYTTQGQADYQLSDRTKLSSSIAWSLADFGNQYVGSQAFTEQVFATYQFKPTLSGSLGISVYQFEIENAPSQIGEGPFLSVNFSPNPRLSLNATAGVSLQQFGGGVPNAIAESFTINANYQVQPRTRISFQAQRLEAPSSVSTGVNYTDTQFGVTLEQRLPHRLVGTLTLGYTLAEYYAVQTNVSTSRTDTFYSIRTDLTLPLTARWAIGWFYEHDGNMSTLSTFQYDRNTTGLNASWFF
jgi:hypothetical protein